MHPNAAHTAEALPGVIEAIRANGLTLPSLDAPTPSPSPPPSPAPTPPPPSPSPSPTPQPPVDDPGAIRACHFDGPEVWLTFDDSVKSNVLRILGEHGVRGIFFPTGYFARRYPDVVDQAREDGHLIGNHSSTHARLTKLSDAQVLAEIDGGVRGTQTPGLLRPPYGAYDQRVIELAAVRDYRLCTWTVASRDSGGASAAEIVANAEKLSAGGVFIMHPNAAHTAEALPGVIEAIRANGLTLPSLDAPTPAG